MADVTDIKFSYVGRTSRQKFSGNGTNDLNI